MECQKYDVKRLQVIFSNELTELIVSEKKSIFVSKLYYPFFSSKHCSIQNGSPHNGDHKDARFKANLIWRVAPEEQFGPVRL